MNKKILTVIALCFTLIIVFSLVYTKKSNLYNSKYTKLGYTQNQYAKKKPIKKSYVNNFENIKVKGIYLTGNSAANNAVIDHIIKLSKSTELNSVVIDVKESGKINFTPLNLMLRKFNSSQPLYNVDALLKRLHDNNIYVIGRIVCFRDSVLAKKRLDLAIRKKDGTIWLENGVNAWTNPYKKEVWDYNINIAKEAVTRGFDEVQFDYVRFPTVNKKEVDLSSGTTSKEDVICGFLEKAESEIHRIRKVPVSADIFGIICQSKIDGENIGQDIEKIGMKIDYLSPMIYPSHYANSSKGMMGNGVGQIINGIKFKAPDLDPYNVVYNTLVLAKKRISSVNGFKAKIRPYLQDFTANYLPSGYYQEYGANQVREQIKAVYDSGYDQWILWDAGNTYSEDAFLKENK